MFRKDPLKEAVIVGNQNDKEHGDSSWSGSLCGLVAVPLHRVSLFSFRRELCRAVDREVLEKGSVKVDYGRLHVCNTTIATLSNGKYASLQRLTICFRQNTGKKYSKGPKFLLVPRDFRVGMSVKIIHY